MKKLKTLSLEGNQLKTLPAKLSQLDALQLLNLKNNQIKGFDAEIRNLTNLRELNLQKNPLNSTEQKRIQDFLPKCVIKF
jgi:Leucine-rich repeat (LRR) protein